MLLAPSVSKIEKEIDSRAQAAIFVMPATSKDWKGSEALWISTAGWAEAAKNILGNAIIVTRDRIATAEEVLEYPLNTGKPEQKKVFLFKSLPPFVKVFLKDIQEWNSSRNWNIFNQLSFKEGEVAFVWEKHDLFSGSGLKVARKYGVPYISYVHAPVIWEARKWGVKRFIWGQFLERRETSVLKKSDVVATVSEEVKERLIEMGVPKEKILVSPMAVDLHLFKVPLEDSNRLRKQLGLEGNFVIGWTGSFRKFHGLEQIIYGFQKIVQVHQDAVLVLVGEGREQESTKKLITQLGLQSKVIFPGKKPYKEIPTFLSIFDIAVAGAETAANFHYSPLKIRDYMAAGIAVLAPEAGEIPNIFREGKHLKLFKVGDVDSFFEQLLFLLDNKEQREQVAQEGHQFVLTQGTWEYELRKCLEFMKTL